MHFKSDSTPKRTATLLALGMLTLAPGAHAFSPLQTEDTGTQGKANSEIEIGYVFERSTNLDMDLDDRIDVSEVSGAIPASYTFGLTDRLDASIGIGRQVNPERGWQNTELSLKWNFWGNAESGWSAAIKPTLILPVSKGSQTRGLGSASTNWAMALIGSYTADDYEFHANLKYQSNYLANTIDAPQERSGIWTASVSPVWNINEQWKVGLDLGLQSNPDYASRNVGFTQLGVSYAPLENLQVGLGVGFSRAWGAESKDRGMSVTTTLAYQF